MALKDVFKITRKTFLNPSGWIDADAITEQTRTIVTIFKNMTAKPVPGKTEVFENVIKKEGLNDKDIAEGIGTYRAIALCFLILALGSTGYGLYLLIKYFSLSGAILSFSMAALFFAQAFKYDFWAFVMSQRKLGLTFADWKRWYIG